MFSTRTRTLTRVNICTHARVAQLHRQLRLFLGDRGKMPRLLFCIVSLLHLVRGQGVWSDSVNSYTEDFDYECSNNTALVGIASIFR